MLFPLVVALVLLSGISFIALPISVVFRLSAGVGGHFSKGYPWHSPVNRFAAETRASPVKTNGQSTENQR
jgi:hypothetical protein